MADGNNVHYLNATRIPREEDLPPLKLTRRDKMELYLPYGMWTCRDGRQILFNRRYMAIWQKWPDGRVDRPTEGEWYDFDKRRGEGFLYDAHWGPRGMPQPPWKDWKTLLILFAVMRQFGVPEEDVIATWRELGR